MYGESSVLDAKVLEMGFENSDISMLVILPNKFDGLTSLESELHQVNFQDLSKTLNEENVEVKIPKFKIEFDITMNEPLTTVSIFKDIGRSFEFL